MSLLESLRETEEAVIHNYDVNLAINELAAIQNESMTIPSPLSFTVSMVPVCETDEGFYCVDSRCFNMMLQSENMTVTEGIKALREQLESDINTNDYKLGMVFRKEDTDALYETVMNNPAKITPKCEAVVGHNDFIKEVKESGVEIIFSE